MNYLARSNIFQDSQITLRKPSDEPNDAKIPRKMFRENMYDIVLIFKIFELIFHYSKNSLRLSSQPKWVSSLHPEFGQPKWVANLSEFLDLAKYDSKRIQNNIIVEPAPQ